MSKSTFQRIVPNLYIRDGWYHTLHRVDGKQKWRSLRTQDLEEAERRMGRMHGNGDNGDQAAEIAELKAMVAQLLAVHSNQNGATKLPALKSPYQPTTKSLTEIFKDYIESRKWPSDGDTNETRNMYKSRSNRIVEHCKDNWERFGELGPYETWRAIKGSNSLRNHVAAFFRGFESYALEQNLTVRRQPL